MIDLRSDTVTRPSNEMWDVMRSAPLGDDVLGDDPSVRDLEEFAAELLGYEAAVFASSGTQTNLLALMSHCDRADEYIVGQHAHTYRWEGGGAAVFGSIQPQPLVNNPDGTIDLDLIEAAVKPNDPHYAVTRLLALENTWNGHVLPLSYQAEARALVDRHGLSMHLDGARMFNAVAALGGQPTDITAPYDSVSVCLSKGLGAPVGSILAGSRELIGKARRHRKRLGGGMRQAGMLAAAGRYGLEHNAPHMTIDHDNAARLAQGLAGLESITVDSTETNMVFASVTVGSAADLVGYAEANGVALLGGEAPGFRMVTHLDVNAADVDRVIEVFSQWIPASDRPHSIND